jgi:hypothetical protein
MQGDLYNEANYDQSFVACIPAVHWGVPDTPRQRQLPRKTCLSGRLPAPEDRLPGSAVTGPRTAYLQQRELQLLNC